MVVTVVAIANGGTVATASKTDDAGKGLMWLIIVVLVVLFSIGSCIKGAVDDGSRERRAKTEGGGTVLVVAPDDSCWALTATDERLEDGVLGGDPEDEVSSTDREEFERSGGEFTKSGCGTETVTLPTKFIYGSVGVYVGDEGKFNYAAWLWLTKKLATRGGAISTDDHDNSTAVFASDPATVYDNASWSADEISEVFGPAISTELRDEARAFLKKSKVNPDVFDEDRVAAAKTLTDAKKWDSIASAQDALYRLAGPIGGAQAADLLLGFGMNWSGAVYEEGFPASIVQEIDAMEASGPATAAQVPTIRTNVANELLAQIKPASDASSMYLEAAKHVGALAEIDPSQAARFKRLTTQWKRTGAKLEAEEKAEEARRQAELDEWTNNPPTGSGDLDCDGDGDGICYE